MPVDVTTLFAKCAGFGGRSGGDSFNEDTIASSVRVQGGGLGAGIEKICLKFVKNLKNKIPE